MNTERIEDLKRRIQRDSASIAFAQLGEEFRRAGRFREAIDTCRRGLDRHPGYLSARVTLGRALLEIGDLAPAERELQEVLRVAPDNLTALRGLADICYRRDDRERALTYYRRSLALAPHDSELQQMVAEISRQISVASPAVTSAPAAILPAFTMPPAPDPVLQAAFEPVPSSVPPVAPSAPPPVAVAPAADVAATSALLIALERWHAAILANRK